MYDLMREAANRLSAVFAERVAAGGLDDPAIQEIRAIRSHTQGVDAHNITAQEAMTAVFNERYETIAGHPSVATERSTTSAKRIRPSV